jgi:hypothetical protein
VVVFRNELSAEIPRGRSISAKRYSYHVDDEIFITSQQSSFRCLPAHQRPMNPMPADTQIVRRLASPKPSILSLFLCQFGH